MDWCDAGKSVRCTSWRRKLLDWMQPARWVVRPSSAGGRLLEIDKVNAISSNGPQGDIVGIVLSSDGVEPALRLDTNLG